MGSFFFIRFRYGVRKGYKTLVINCILIVNWMWKKRYFIKKSRCFHRNSNHRDAGSEKWNLSFFVEFFRDLLL